MSDAGGAPLLEVRNVAVRFDGIVALDGVSFKLQKGQVLGLIGPNGAGKTTMFNCLSRLYTPTEGDVLFEGASILPRSAHDMAAIGIGRTFQNVALFSRLTVRENVLIGGHSHTNSNFWNDSLRLPGSRGVERQLEKTAQELIDYLQLGDVADRPVAGLPFGTQKRVELARALAASPKLLLLDEPAGGLNHDEVFELGRLVKQIRDDRNVTVLLVEHHMGLVMSISDNVVALNFGKKIAEGAPDAVRKDPELIRAYLGGEAA
ncbi:MAG TPA: ABC transporter ATP-binding protein [Rhodoblastus sp.]|nr:ABC transporter ATP-binding protein [Rhodoblastus sp.]